MHEMHLPCTVISDAKKEVKRMMADDDYDDEEKYISDYCLSYYPCAAGFIFYDGSVLDIGQGEDHRVISEYRWKTENIITYRMGEDILFIRMPSEPSVFQKKTIKEILSCSRISTINYDIGYRYTFGEVQKNSVNYYKFKNKFL